jgi:hypothetical protein
MCGFCGYSDELSRSSMLPEVAITFYTELLSQHGI